MTHHRPVPTRSPAFDVKVIRSRRRRKTIEAALVEGVLEVRVPAWLDEADEARCVADMVDRFERRRVCDDDDIEGRARRLARTYHLPEPSSVRWVENQRKRWGSCSPHRGTIRLSTRMAGFPSWVVDYVLVHELAHLVEANHSPAFKALVARYPRAERAEGFLEAKGLGAHDDLTSEEPGNTDLTSEEPDLTSEGPGNTDLTSEEPGITSEASLF
jgi:hypothetical protein